MATTVLRPAEPQPQTVDSVSDSACSQLRHLYPHKLSVVPPRQASTDIPHPNLDQESAGSESESPSPIEPITPVSHHRHSRNYSTSSQFDHTLTLQHCATQNSLASHLQHVSLGHHTSKDSPVFISAPDLGLRRPFTNPATTTNSPTSPTSSRTPKHHRLDTPLSQPPSHTRPTSSFKRKMASLFRRSSAVERDPSLYDTSSTSSETFVYNRHTGPTSAPRSIPALGSFRSTSTASNSPPTPDSPLEMMPSNQPHAVYGKSLPGPEDFGKKVRTGTGFTFRGRVSLVTRSGRSSKNLRRANSFDADNRAVKVIPSADVTNRNMYPADRQPWALPPDAGTGTKARRMSLILPNDFTIDIAELLSEFEYQHKLLGRHGKHLGKGAASKVTLMARKGCPNELYAVKEFRGKSKSESTEEYEKKIKSEFSIAKSLHHPNIVETIRLCTDHGRWNHVMEYCSEGDLFGLVQKGYFKGDAKLKDRLCIFKQLIQGVTYLHAHGIAHRDIKLENLLITKDSKIKITDFGVSEVFTGTHPGLREAHGMCGQNMGELRLCSPGICGSEPYIAPEVLAKSKEYDPRALDVWSAGIVLIYLNFGGAIWSRAEPGNTHYDKLVKGWERWYRDHPDPDATITDTDYPKCLALDVGVNPPALRRVLLQMLNPNPAKRIMIQDVASNRWIKNIECCQVESYDDPVNCIDATKKDCINNKKIFCHNHLPPKTAGSHSLGKMPGQAGY